MNKGEKNIACRTTTNRLSNQYNSHRLRLEATVDDDDQVRCRTSLIKQSSRTNKSHYSQAVFQWKNRNHLVSNAVSNAMHDACKNFEQGYVRKCVRSLVQICFVS